MDTRSGNWVVSILLGVICILLGGLLATNLSIMRQYKLEEQRWAVRQQQVELIRAMAELQEDAIFDLLVDYQDTAYSSRVERIAEQQLLAAESQLSALQLIALQNSQITKLLLLTYEDLPSEPVITVK